MNFLSHYYCLQKENPYFILGAVMPDMVKDFSRIYNKRIEDEFIPTINSNKEILLGIENHIKADDIFHKHILFEQMQEIAKTEMKNEFGTKVKRQFVLAHVLIEIMIDQYVINNNETILDLFYNKLSKIDVSKANLFFENLKVDEETSHFKRNFTNFIRLKFLFRLKENEGVIFTLNKVFSKRLNYDFLEDIEKWNVVLNNIKESIEKDIPILIEDVKMKLYE